MQKGVKIEDEFYIILYSNQKDQHVVEKATWRKDRKIIT